MAWKSTSCGKCRHFDDESDVKTDVFNVDVVDLQKSLLKAVRQKLTSDSDSAPPKTPEGIRSRPRTHGKAKN